MYDFDDPRFLPCFHTFCRRCLDQVITLDYKNGSFGCPLCQETVTVPQNGTNGFPVNLFLKKDKTTLKDIPCDVCDDEKPGVFKCRECHQNLCNKCVNIHEKMQGTTSHCVYPIPPKSKLRLPYCREHTGEELEYFCDICEIVVCQVCIKFSHQSHPIQDVSSVAEALKDEIAHFLATSDKSSDSRRYNLQVAKQQTKMNYDEDNIMDAIDKQTKRFKAVVEDVRRDFVRQLLEAIADCKDEIKDNKDIVSKNCAAVDNLRQIGKLFVRNANDCEIIKYGPILKEKLNISEYGKTDLQDMQKIDFLPKDIAMKDVKRLFGFFTPAKYDFAFLGGVNIIQSFHCSLEDCTITSMTVMTDNTLWVCFGNNGVLERYSYTGLKKAEIRLEHRIDCVASDSNDVLYVTCNAEKEILTFNKTNLYKREHFIDTELCCRGIAIDKNDCLVLGMTERDVFFNSTCPQMGSVAMISPDKTVVKLHSDDLVQYPARVAVNKSGAIAISDWIRLCVIIFRNNKKVGYFDGKGFGFIHFLPKGICSTNDGNFIIVDTASNCLHWISEYGDLLRTIESINGIGEPYSVTMDQHDAVWMGTKDGRIVQMAI